MLDAAFWTMTRSLAAVDDPPCQEEPDGDDEDQGDGCQHRDLPSGENVVGDLEGDAVDRLYRCRDLHIIGDVIEVDQRGIG